mmetsp:Transcript_5694/g.11350  ORF Transcript_5694/g.11350 Transcript_5694/m.11350 type:complete len:213 (-) Transcript_5694:1527-2165(-)
MLRRASPRRPTMRATRHTASGGVTFSAEIGSQKSATGTSNAFRPRCLRSRSRSSADARRRTSGSAKRRSAWRRSVSSASAVSSRSAMTASTAPRLPQRRPGCGRNSRPRKQQLQRPHPRPGPRGGGGGPLRQICRRAAQPHRPEPRAASAVVASQRPPRARWVSGPRLPPLPRSGSAGVGSGAPPPWPRRMAPRGERSRARSTLGWIPTATA